MINGLLSSTCTEENAAKRKAKDMSYLKSTEVDKKGARHGFLSRLICVIMKGDAHMQLANVPANTAK